jgi:hypothetical protein
VIVNGRSLVRLATLIVAVLSLLTGIALPEFSIGQARAEPSEVAVGVPSRNVMIADDKRSSVDSTQRNLLLQNGWKASKDIALATSGDTTGFHLLVAEGSTGYQWRTVATLSEPGMDTDQWIGNACLTGSGDRVMAVYAPRHFTNRPELFARGAFAAIIDINSGAVTKLKDQVSLAYFNPGCGADGAVALTQSADEQHLTSRLLLVETSEGKSTDPVVLPGQITSAVPYQDGYVAARGTALVSVSGVGKVKTLAKAGSVPFDVHVDDQGGVAFAEEAAGRMTIRYHHDGKTRTLAAGNLGELSIRAESFSSARRRRSKPFPAQ